MIGTNNSHTPVSVLFMGGYDIKMNLLFIEESTHFKAREEAKMELLEYAQFNFKLRT